MLAQYKKRHKRDIMSTQFFFNFSYILSMRHVKFSVILHFFLASVLKDAQALHHEQAHVCFIFHILNYRHVMFSAILHSIIWFWFKFIFYISYVSCFGIKGCSSVTSWAHTVTSRLTERGPLNTSTERREIVCDNKCWHFFKLLLLANLAKELQDKKK